MFSYNCRVSLVSKAHYADITWRQIDSISLEGAEYQPDSKRKILLRHLEKFVNVRQLYIMEGALNEQNIQISLHVMPQITRLIAPESIPRELLDRVNISRLEHISISHTFKVDNQSLGSDFMYPVEYLAARGPLKALIELVQSPASRQSAVSAFTKYPTHFPALEKLKTSLPGPLGFGAMAGPSPFADLLAALCAVAQHANLKQLYILDMYAPKLFGNVMDSEMWRNLPQFVRQNLKLDITDIKSSRAECIWIQMPPELAGTRPDAYSTVFEACYKTDSARLDAISARLDYGGMQPVALPWMITKVEPLIKRTHAKDLVEGDAESERWFGQIAWVIMHLLSWNPTNTDGVWGVLQGEFNRLVDELGFSKYLSLALRPDHRFSAGRVVVSTLMGQSEEWWRIHNVVDALLEHPAKSELLLSTDSALLDRLQKSSRFMESIVVDSALANDMVLPKLEQLYRVERDDTVPDTVFDALLKEIQKFISSTGLPSSLQQGSSKMLPVWLRTEERARQVGSFFSDFHLLRHCQWAWRTMASAKGETITNFRLALQSHQARYGDGSNSPDEMFAEAMWNNYVLSLEPVDGRILRRVKLALPFTVTLPPKAVEILSTSSQLFATEQTEVIKYLLAELPKDAPARFQLEKIAEKILQTVESPGFGNLVSFGGGY
jgi:hypothetical protein